MQKNYFQIPYYVLNLSCHGETKQKLIEYINKANFNSSAEITKTDFQIDHLPEYKTFLIPIIVNELDKIFPKEKINILNCWFQEYQKYSYHPFHSHECQWALVYYVNLPTGSSPTAFQTDADTVIRPELKEGDIIVFPGWIKHKSPPNNSKESKIIISMNFDVK